MSEPLDFDAETDFVIEDDEPKATSTFWNKFGLTYKQFLFCEEYLIHFNAAQAYRAVYGQAYRSGSNVLKSRKVQKYLRERMNQKMSTRKRLLDIAMQQLEGDMLKGDKEATKLFLDYEKKAQEIEAKLAEKEAEASQEKENYSIQFKVVKDEQDS